MTKKTEEQTKAEILERQMVADRNQSALMQAKLLEHALNIEEQISCLSKLDELANLNKQLDKLFEKSNPMFLELEKTLHLINHALSNKRIALYCGLLAGGFLLLVFLASGLGVLLFSCLVN